LHAEAERRGTVALWAAPTISGTRRSKRPNVIFYIIDGAGADYMSVYGYNRRTTPNLERLAAEGALIESAYSNSSWTRPSTASFLSSLHHSAMGGMRNNRVAPPEEVLTIPEQLHQAGYQTAFFTSNPNAATMSNLDRGVDVLREKSVEPTSHSTRELHKDFWDWRHDYPGQPYWVHFQTTDVHWPHNPPTPFSGLFVSPERRKVLDQWEEKLKATNLWRGPWGKDAFEKAGVDRAAFYTGKRDLYTEGMAHQDHQIGRLVERLKATGEWGDTLLIIAADHGAQAGSEDYEIAVMDELPSEWGPSFRPGITRIPMIFIWPGRIPAGQRISGPASMIDMLPTILDLLDLPQPEVMQGRSLAPFLLQEADWEPSPIIFDEFYVNATSGKLLGSIEVVDGRWGASLEIVQEPEEDERPPGRRRPVPLLVYDLWNDPGCLRSLHEERPDLVEKYSEFLLEQFEVHQALAQQFTRGEDSPLDAEQLETLRTLGYIE
jgi:arylsulfatase A-like enzyme